MKDTAITIHHISKQYRIGKRERYQTLRDSIANAFFAPIHNFLTLNKNRANRQNPTSDTFWALKDVSLEIKKGDVVGVVGANGAGKSTLLKILARITEPTKGTVELKGRVGSLLEVGTGFHPELTGRENIYLSGAILGMSRGEIDAKFEIIVDFADTKKFLDTPIKHYSSGMQMRLAFAVAAHLEPEILLVDEVLAVGDMEFQKKCLGKMSDIARGGRTVLFVSHNLAAVARLCSKALLLQSGRLVLFDQVDKVIDRYLRDMNQNSQQYVAPNIHLKEIYVKTLKTIDERKKTATSFSFFEKVNLLIQVQMHYTQSNLLLGVAVLDKWGKKVFTTIYPIKDILSNKFTAIVAIPEKTLLSGTYSFDVALFIPSVEIFDYVSNQCHFNVIDTGSKFAPFGNADIGTVNVDCQWSIY